MNRSPLVLGIETSCDETGAGLVRGHELLADSVASSVAEHARFGGVVPEVASRAHLEAMVATVDRALATAGVKLAEVDGIAVTAGRGERPVHGRDHGLQVRSAGYLGHYPAEPGVLRHAGGHRVRQQLVPAHQAGARLVTRGLDAKHQWRGHVTSLPRRQPASCFFLAGGSWIRRITRASVPDGW